MRLLDLMHPDLRPKPKDWKGERVLRIEPKYDGFRTTLYRTYDRVVLMGRQSYTDHYDSVCDDLQALLTAVPPGTVVDGELHAPGLHATEVPKLMKFRDERVVFSPFAVPVFGDVNMMMASFEERDEALIQMDMEPPRPLSAIAFNEESLQLAAIDHDVEGWVLKRSHYSGWYKVKRTYTVDAVITGIKPGKGRNEGLIGSFEISLVDVTGEYVSIGNCNARTDEIRQLDPDAQMYRVIEVQFDEVAGRGKLKMPRMLRFRPDKEAAECSVAQLATALKM